MDLRQWSRAALLKEARRLRIADPAAMTRDALVGAILRRWGHGPKGALSAARAAVGRVLRFGRAGRGTPDARETQELADPRGSGGPEPAPQSTRPPETIPDSEPARDTSGQDEPIRTRTMARLLAEQAYYRRALAIYDALLDSAPDDEGLRREAEQVRANATRGHPSARDEPPDELEREVVALAVDSTRLLVSWEVAEPAVRRAKQVLGAPGILTARVVVVAPDTEQVVRSETREQRDIDASGQWVVDELPRGARATASVGLLEGERFVSIGHAPTIFLEDATR